MPRLESSFLDFPIPETCLWEQFRRRKKSDFRHRTLTSRRQAHANQQRQEQAGRENPTDSSKIKTTAPSAPPAYTFVSPLSSQVEVQPLNPTARQYAAREPASWAVKGAK